MSGKTQES